MISGDTDFFPVGYKVRMPNVHNHSGHGSISAPSRPSPRSNTLTSARVQSHQVTKKEVNELGKLLTFSDDVVSHRSPNSVTYNKAREGAQALFKTSELGDVRIGSHLKTSKGVVGRHDCRGEPKRHLPCHLQSDDQSSTLLSTQWSTHLPKKGSTFRHVASGRSGEEEFLLGRVRSVAPSQSIPWQEQTLTKVSSSTARHLIGLPSSESLADRQLSFKRSHQLIPDSSSDKHLDAGGEEATLCTDSNGVRQQKGFIKELQMGAKPVHQTRGDGNSILLTNNTRYNKVLQPSYPYQPSQWQSEVSKVEASSVKASASDRLEEEDDDGCVIGYRRWLDFPQRATVCLYTCTCRYMWVFL